MNAGRVQFIVILIGLSFQHTGQAHGMYAISRNCTCVWYPGGPDVKIETLIAGLESNYSKIESVVCRYAVRHQTTKAGEKLLSTVFPQAAGSHAEKPHTSFYQRGFWQTKPPAHLFLYRIESRDEATEAVSNTQVFAFDGTKGFQLSQTGDGARLGTVRTGVLDPPASSRAIETLSGIRVSGLNLPLHRVIAGAESAHLDGTHRIGTNECYRVIAKGCKDTLGNPCDVTVYIDLAPGFVVRELEIIETAKAREGFRYKFASQLIGSHHTEHDESVPFPSKATVEFCHPRGGAEPIAIEIVEVEELRLNAPLGTEEFRLEFPPGTVVHNSDTETNSIAGDGDDKLVADRARQALEELQNASRSSQKERASPPSHSNIPTIVAGAVALLIFVAVLVLRRR